MKDIGLKHLIPRSGQSFHCEFLIRERIAGTKTLLKERHSQKSVAGSVSTFNDSAVFVPKCIFFRICSGLTFLLLRFPMKRVRLLLLLVTVFAENYPEARKTRVPSGPGCNYFGLLFNHSPEMDLTGRNRRTRVGASWVLPDLNLIGLGKN